MDSQPKDDTAKRIDQRSPIDPLQRVYIPTEKQNSDGTYGFKTRDGRRYRRMSDGSIRRERI